MRFEEILLEMLLEGKIEDTLARHPTIPDEIKQDYLRQIPANNAQHLDWVLQQHSKGNINPEHSINETLSNFNKVKDKLDKKQIHQYKSFDELHSAILPHLDSIKKSKKEKQEEGTETLYSSPTMTIRQHHNYESCVNAGFLPKNNNSGLDKATWCISVGDGGGAAHYDYYTDAGFHPVYSIEHHHPDGTSSKHMFVYDYNTKQGKQELRDEHDKIVRGSIEDNYEVDGETEDYNDDGEPPTPYLLDHYGSEHPEILKTPIAKFFTEEGRNEYKKKTIKEHEKYYNLLSSIPQNGMSDEEYMHFFKEGQKKQQGGIHNQLAKSILSSTQLDHLVNHGNEGCSHELATRHDLSDDHMTKLSNTSNMLTHYNLLNNSKLPVDAFNNILNKGHSEVAYKIINHPMFNHSHIDTILNKKLDKKALTELSRKFYNHLDSGHMNKIIDNGDSDTLSRMTSIFKNKLDSTHIHKIIDKSDKYSCADTIKNTDNLKEEHIDKIIKKYKDSENVNNILLGKHHLLTDTQFKTILPNANTYNINKIYNSLSPQHQKLAVDYVQHLKDNNDKRWEKFNNIHNHMNLTNVEHVKLSISNSDETNHQIEHNLSEKELQEHIHPLINHIIDTEPRYKLSSHLINFAGLINKEQTNRILDNINGFNINYATNSNLPNHVRDAIIDKGIKNNNPVLVHKTLLHIKDTSNIPPHHLEYIKQHLPIHMPSIDIEGVHAKEVIQNAFENPNKDSYKVQNGAIHSNIIHYRRAYLDHVIKNDYRYELYRYINNRRDLSHEDLDKIVPYAIKNDYEDGILTKRIAEVPNLSSNHISHIIASGHLGAIKKMIDSQSKSNFTKQHLDDMIDIKDKEISNKLAEYPILGKEQEERNNKVLQESTPLFKNNFEKILLETYRDK